MRKGKSVITRINDFTKYHSISSNLFYISSLIRLYEKSKTPIMNEELSTEMEPGICYDKHFVKVVKIYQLPKLVSCCENLLSIA